MVKTSLKTRIVCGVVAGIITLGTIGGVFGYNYVKANFKTADNYISKDIDAELGSTDNPFTVIEIVADESMGTFGYYLPGYEPVTPKQAGYDFNGIGNYTYAKLKTGGVMKMAETTEYGIPTSSDGSIMKLGFAYDVFEEAGGIISKQQVWTLTKNTLNDNKTPIYIEEGYFERVEAGKGHYRLDPSTHHFVKVDDGFAYLYSQGVNDSIVEGSFAAEKNAAYTGNAGGNYNWVKTGYYITSVNSNSAYDSYDANIYNKQPFIMENNAPRVDGIRGAENDYSGGGVSEGVNYSQLPGWNSSWMDVIKRIYDGEEPIRNIYWRNNDDIQYWAALEEFVNNNVEFGSIGVKGYAIKNGATALTPPEYTTTKDSSYIEAYISDYNTKCSTSYSYDGLITIGSDGKYDCKDEEFFKKFIYMYNCVRKAQNQPTIGTISASDYSEVYSAGYNYYSYNGNSIPYLNLDQYTVNAECTDPDTERFYTLRADTEQLVLGTKFYCYENTNALLERIFGESENVDDVEYQYVLITTKELRDACAANGNKLPEKYKNLIDYADFISIPGDYAIGGRYSDYAERYYRFHPEVEKKTSAELEMSRYEGGKYVNDLPADAVYEIFLRQANALEIEGLRPAGIMFNNLNQATILGSDGSSDKTNWNYIKLFVLIMEYGPYNLYVNHVENDGRIYMDYSTGNLMAKPLYYNKGGAPYPASGPAIANWWMQMFEPYSADVNNIAYGGGQIISGNALSLDGGLDFASNFTRGAAISGDGFRTQDLINSTYIDDKYKEGNQFTAATVFEYLIGANDNYKDHINVLELQNDDGKFITGAAIADRRQFYYDGYPLSREEEVFYENYLSYVMPWFTGSSIKYPDGITTVEEKRHYRFNKNYTVNRMTVAEFNASTIDICGEYDLIIIGSGVAESNGKDLTNKKYSEIQSFLKMGAVIFDSGYTATTSVFNNKANIKKLLNIANSHPTGGSFNYKTATPVFNYDRLTPYSDQLKALTNAISQYKCQVKMNSFDMPDPYISYENSEGLFTGAQYNGNVLTFSFKFKGIKNAKYRCQLFIDRDGADSNKVVHACDGVFDGTVKSKKALGGVDMGTEAVPISIVGTLSSDGYLVRNKSYTVNCDVSALELNGYLPWKLEIYNIDDDNIRTTVTGSTAVSNGAKQTIRVLQMCPTSALKNDMTKQELEKVNVEDMDNEHLINLATTGLGTSHWGERIDIGAGEKFHKYMDAINNNSDYEISIRYKSNSDWYREFNNAEGDETAWIDELENYDILVLGFSQSLSKSNNDIFNKGVENFINSGRGVVIGNNYLNTVSNDDRTRAGMLNDRKQTLINKQKVIFINESKITNYPYNLVDRSGSVPVSNLDVQSTNFQEFALNLESMRQGDVVVSYVFSDDRAGATIAGDQRNVPNGDASELFYIYNTDNITYLGIGCNTQYGNMVTDDEVKLFINTLFGAYRAIPEHPYLVVTNEDFYPNNTKAALSTGYIELIGDTAGLDVDVSLKAVCDTDDVEYSDYNVVFLDKGDSSSMATFDVTRGAVSVWDDGKAAEVTRDVPFSFTASYERAKAMKGNYYVRLTTRYKRKGYDVETPYLQKIQLLPMAMFDLY